MLEMLLLPCCAVRFGKYTPLRNKERDVKMYVNGELIQHAAERGSAARGWLAICVHVVSACHCL